MCREGQRKVPRAIIIADKNFPGDSEAFKIKSQRCQEEVWLRTPFDAIDKAAVDDAWEQVEALYIYYRLGVRRCVRFICNMIGY